MSAEDVQGLHERGDEHYGRREFDEARDCVAAGGGRR